MHGHGRYVIDKYANTSAKKSNRSGWPKGVYKKPSWTGRLLNLPSIFAFGHQLDIYNVRIDQLTLKIYYSYRKRAVDVYFRQGQSVQFAIMKPIK